MSGDRPDPLDARPDETDAVLDALVQRAALGEELFQKVKDTPGDILMAVQDVENNLADGITHEDGKVHLHIPRLDDWVAEISPAAEVEKLEGTGYPLVLAAGERTDFNATSRMRNKEWMGDRQPCTLKMHPEDAEAIDPSRFRSNTRFESDPDVARADVHVSTPQGLLVRDLDATLTRVREELLEANR